MQHIIRSEFQSYRIYFLNQDSVLWAECFNWPGYSQYMIAYMIFTEYIWKFQKENCIVGMLLHSLLSSCLLTRLHGVVNVFLEHIECSYPQKGTTVCFSIYLRFLLPINAINYFLTIWQTPEEEFRSNLALKLKSQMLLALLDKTLYPDDAAKREKVWFYWRDYSSSFFMVQQSVISLLLSWFFIL